MRETGGECLLESLQGSAKRAVLSGDMLLIPMLAAHEHQVNRHLWPKSRVSSRLGF